MEHSTRRTARQCSSRPDTSGHTRGVVYWITGLAGTGKTTVARELAKRLEREGRDVVVLDGDELRRAVFPEVGYSPPERLGLARRYSEICGLLAEQGIDVVCATISMFPSVWEQNRRDLSPYREVLLRAPRQVLLQRRASLYERAGEEYVVGAESEPGEPDLVLENDGRCTPKEIVEELFAAVFTTGDVEGEGLGDATASSLGLGSKAEALERLAPRIRSARILPQVRFTTGAWWDDPQTVLGRIRGRGWLEIPLIVRSSALGEDSYEGSMAGRFLSIGHRLGKEDVRAAIEEVACDLDGARRRRFEDGHDQIFVQPQLQDVLISGVVFTRDPSNGSDYIIVSYDVTSGSTETIPSGTAEDRRTYYHHRDSDQAPPQGLAGLFALIEELEQQLSQEVAGGAPALDLEFAITADGALYLLQLRPLRTAPGNGLERSREEGALTGIRRQLRELGKPHPYLYGTKAVFGTMPDWNPAEIIGVRPHPLAMSLYRELITDGIWAYQRSNYGYRNLRSFPLLVSLAGLPYVDVRVSFNSFLPADLEEGLGRRLVNEWIDRLIESPLDHDKVEFSIVHSCYTLDLERRLQALEERGFDGRDRRTLLDCLRSLTNRVTGADGPFRKDLEKIRTLKERQGAFRVQGSELDRVSKIYWLLEDCKRYGTLPFAGIARAAFIAVQLLDSLVSEEILDPEQRDGFLHSLETVRGRMNADLGRLRREDFLERYGHLRPGTYDVRSMRYDETPDAYFDSAAAPEGGEKRIFSLSSSQERRLERELQKHGIEHDAASLFRFLKAAIEGREEAKFVFSRSLSDALVEMVRLAEEVGFSREDLAFADVQAVRRCYVESGDRGEALGESIAVGKRRFAVTRRITLPPLVTSPDDAFSFHVPICEPNFVTMGSAVGPVVQPIVGGRELRGGIVLLQSADPGYDWIFAHSVAGFITMYGGYNSHMAIRANELGIPAVIGAGESLFRTWSAASQLRVDCLNHRVEVLG